MRIRTLILTLCVVTFLTYFSSLNNQFVWDDEQFIYTNAFITEFAVAEIFTNNMVAGAGVVSNYYRPFTSLSLSLDYQLWQLNPVGFHLTNTFLHIAAGVLLFLLLLQLGASKWAAFALSSIFLLHPVQTEAVSYINSRGDSLYAFFGLLSCNLFLLLLRGKIYSIGNTSWNFRLSTKWLMALVPLTYAASILSKEIGIAIGGVLFLLTLREVNFRTAVNNLQATLEKMKLPLTSLAVAAVVGISYLVLRAGPLNFQNSYNFYSDGSPYSESVVVRLLSFSKIVFTYLRILIWPQPLHMERYSEVITAFSSPWPWLLFGLILVLAALSWYEHSRHRTTWIGFGSAWFFMLLLPTSGIIAINGMLYEHWLYLPMIGFFIVVGRIISLIPVRMIHKNATQLPILIILLIIYSTLTIRQNYYWSTPVRLYEHLLSYTDSARIHNNLGMAYADEGKLLDAVTQYHKALSYGIPYPQVHHNLGNVLGTLGDTSQAEEEYLKALAVDPRFQQSYYKLSTLYAETNQNSKLLALILTAQAAVPENPQFLQLEIEARRPLTASESAELRQKALERFSKNPTVLRQIDTLLLQ